MSSLTCPLLWDPCGLPHLLPQQCPAGTPWSALEGPDLLSCRVFALGRAATTSQSPLPAQDSPSQWPAFFRRPQFSRFQQCVGHTQKALSSYKCGTHDTKGLRPADVSSCAPHGAGPPVLLVLPLGLHVPAPYCWNATLGLVTPPPSTRASSGDLPVPWQG